MIDLSTGVLDVRNQKRTLKIDRDGIKMMRSLARAFPVAAARTWNSLSRSLTSLSSLASFRRMLKTELFSRSFPDLDSSAHDLI